jgi:RNA polymerase sigma-70 factor (sigma-E family)
MSQDIEEFVRRSRPRLLRAARLLSGSWTSGEDLLQEAYSRTWQKWGQFDSDRAGEAYVLKAMARLHVKSSRRHWRGEIPTDSIETAALEQDVDTAMTVRVALGKLPPRQRLVVIYRFYLDMSVDETAEAMSSAAGTVKSQTARAVAKLGAELVSDPREASHGQVR